MPVIRGWLREQTVLLTGGTGFLGQAIIYKLLQCGCPRILVLLRPKKTKSAQQRLDEMIQGYAFDSLRDKVDIPSKLTTIPCNTDVSGLGISDEHLKIIQEKVTVVIHGAASVKFDDPLKAATLANLRMTRDVAEVALKIKNLQVLQYISTSFSNCEYMMNGVEERIYDAKMDWRTMIKAAENIPEEVLNSMESKLLGASPNTYIFTKHLAETLVNEYGQKIPVVIFRPPIVISALREPEPGWMCNLGSPIAIVGGSGKGVLRLYHGVKNTIKAYIQSDIVVNGALVCAWQKATLHSTELVPVFNCKYMKVTTKKLSESCFPFCSKLPMKDAIWYPRFHCVPNRHAYLILHLLMHILPGLLIDGALKLTGNKTRMMRLYRKMYMAFVLLAPFLNVSDYFHTNNFDELMDNLPEDEKETFYSDTEWPQSFSRYLEHANRGFRAFLGEPKEIHPNDYIRINRLYYLDLALTYGFYLLVIWHVPYNYLFSCSSLLLQNIINIFDIESSN